MLINVPRSINACPLNVFKLFIRPQISTKKINRKQCWNMWILEYLLNFSPQVIYHCILKTLKLCIDKILVDHCVIQTNSRAEAVWIRTMVWSPATFKEELSALTETFIKAAWCNISLSAGKSMYMSNVFLPYCWGGDNIWKWLLLSHKTPSNVYVL